MTIPVGGLVVVVVVEVVVVVVVVVDGGGGDVTLGAVVVVEVDVVEDVVLVVVVEVVVDDVVVDVGATDVVVRGGASVEGVGRSAATGAVDAGGGEVGTEPPSLVANTATKVAKTATTTTRIAMMLSGTTPMRNTSSDFLCGRSERTPVSGSVDLAVDCSDFVVGVLRSDCIGRRHTKPIRTSEPIRITTAAAVPGSAPSPLSKQIGRTAPARSNEMDWHPAAKIEMAPIAHEPRRAVNRSRRITRLTVTVRPKSTAVCS